MKYRIRKIEDEDEARSLYNLVFPTNTWALDGHEYWVVKDEAGEVAGFCSAVYWPTLDTVFLSSCAVTMAARGKGLQRRMIDIRVKWGRKSGARYAFTYVAVGSYASLSNLLGKGFRGVWRPSSTFPAHVLYKTLDCYWWPNAAEISEIAWHMLN